MRFFLGTKKNFYMFFIGFKRIAKYGSFCRKQQLVNFAIFNMNIGNNFYGERGWAHKVILRKIVIPLKNFIHNSYTAEATLMPV